MSARGVLAAVLAATALVLTGTGTGSATSSAGPQVVAKVGVPHLDSQLAQVALTARASGTAAALATARAESFAVTANRVRVIVASAGNLAATRDAVEEAGGRIEATADGLVQALVPPGSLPQLAGAADVTDVRAPATPFAQSLPVDEAIAATNANAWQTAGDDGAGVKVAIIDLGFYGYSSLLGTALPASVTPDDRCGGHLAASPASGGTEHGTAVAELVHQMAPGAQLYLMCVDTEVDLKLAEQDAIAAGVKVINHSVGWFNTSRGDGTGVAGSPDATVADARAHGILWVNAAGNYATQHWNGNFNPSGADPDFNNFGTGELNAVTIQGGEQGCAFLKWDAWPVTSEDFDLYLYREAGGQAVGNPVAFSAGDQSASVDPTDGPATPTEALCYTNAGSTGTFGIAIVRFSASTSPRFDLYFTGSSGLQYSNPPVSVIEPASSPSALAVGADCWQTGALEFFSSQGATIDGRTKPDLIAPDSVSTVTYGNADPSAGGCGTSGFAGTSASSPQVAGAAADLLERDPSLTPAELEGALEATSLANASASDATNMRGHGALWLGNPTLPGSPTQPSNTTIPSLTVSGSRTGARRRPSRGNRWQVERERTDRLLLRLAALQLGRRLVLADRRSDRRLVHAGILGRRLDDSGLGHGEQRRLSRYGDVQCLVGRRRRAAGLVDLADDVRLAARGSLLSLATSGTWSGSPSFTDQWRRCRSDGGGCTDIGGATSSSYLIAGADVGSTIRVAVTGTSSAGSGVATSAQSAVVFTVPGAPTAVSATAGAGQATVSFSAPGSNGGSAITSYTVTTSPGGATATGSGSPLTVTGLTNGTTYTFTVQATNAAGAGAPSAPSPAVTPAAPAGGWWRRRRRLKLACAHGESVVADGRQRRIGDLDDLGREHGRCLPVRRECQRPAGPGVRRSERRFGRPLLDGPDGDHHLHVLAGRYLGELHGQRDCVRDHRRRPHDQHHRHRFGDRAGSIAAGREAGLGGDPETEAACEPGVRLARRFQLETGRARQAEAEAVPDGEGLEAHDARPDAPGQQGPQARPLDRA